MDLKVMDLGTAYANSLPYGEDILVERLSIMESGIMVHIVLIALVMV